MHSVRFHENLQISRSRSAARGNGAVAQPATQHPGRIAREVPVMPRATNRVSNRGAGQQSVPQRPTPTDAERLTSLARLNFGNQNSGLSLPRIDRQPTVYSHTVGDDTSLALAESFIKLGLGTMEMGKKAGNCTRFLAEAFNTWLQDIGARTTSLNTLIFVSPLRRNRSPRSSRMGRFSP